MNLIKQNDARCSILIRKIGCFFRSATALAELHTGKELTVRQINELWEQSVAEGYIKGTKIVRSAPISTLALRALGDGGRFVEIGTFKNGIKSLYAGVQETGKTYYIQKIKANNPDGTHFRVVSSIGDLVFDPYEPSVNNLGIFYSILYSYRGNGE
jgi:hypothetical protein